MTQTPLRILQYGTGMFPLIVNFTLEQPITDSMRERLVQALEVQVGEGLVATYVVDAYSIYIECTHADHRQGLEEICFGVLGYDAYHILRVPMDSLKPTNPARTRVVREGMRWVREHLPAPAGYLLPALQPA